MPLTGDQANFARRFREDTELSDDPHVINQIIGLINGDFGIPVFLTGWNSAAFPSLNIQNDDPAFSWAIRCKDEGGVTFFDLWKGGVTVTPPITMVNVTVSGTITANGVVTANAGIVMGSGDKIDFASEDNYKLRWKSSDDHALGMTSGRVWNQTTEQFEWWKSNGGGSFTKCMNLDMTGGTPVLYVNGVNVSGAVATVTYTGTGTSPGGGIQKTCGFAPSYAILQGGTIDADLQEYHIASTSRSSKFVSSPGISYNSSVKLHASDGIVIADGSTEGNVSGRAYILKAFR